MNQAEVRGMGAKAILAKTFYHCPHCGRCVLIARAIVIGRLDFRCHRCKTLFYGGDDPLDGRPPTVVTGDGVCPDLKTKHRLALSGAL